MLLKWLLLGSRYHFNCLFTGWHWVNHKTCPGGASTARGWVTALDFLKILCLFWDWTHFVFPKGAFDICTSNCAVVKESLCARHPRHLLWHLLTHLAGGRQSWEGPTVIRSQPITWEKNLLLIVWWAHLFLQIVVTNSLPQSSNVARMGSKLEVIDISGRTS